MISEGSFGSLVMQCTKLGLVLGESAGRLGGLAPRATPGPLAIDLDFQRPAQKSPDEHDEAEHADALKCWLYRHRADDIGRDEQFQSDEDRTTQSLSKISVRPALLADVWDDTAQIDGKRGDRANQECGDSTDIEDSGEQLDERGEVHTRTR